MWVFATGLVRVAWLACFVLSLGCMRLCIVGQAFHRMLFRGLSAEGLHSMRLHHTGATAPRLRLPSNYAKRGCRGNAYKPLLGSICSHLTACARTGTVSAAER